MKMKIKQETNTVSLSVAGRIDSSTIRELSASLLQIPPDTKTIIFDFSQLIYISSVGFRELLRLQKNMGDECTISAVGCNDTILALFRQTGFDSFISMEGSAGINPAEELSIKDMFIRTARQNPKKLFVAADRTYTYEEIDRCSHILAADLFKAGVHRGTHVGIYGRNSVNWIVAFLAVQKLGAIGMPLNYQYTTDDLVQVSGIGDITHLLIGEIPNGKTLDELKGMAAGSGSGIRQVIDIGSGKDFSGRDAEYGSLADQFLEKHEAEDDSCMLFTSGSTGNPKAVLLSSAGILHSAKCNVEITHMTADDRICMSVPLFHTTGLIRGFLAALCAGASIHIPNNFETGTLLSFLEEQKCTIMNAIPGTVIAMVNDPSFSEEKADSLRCSILTGAPATEVQMRMLMQKMPRNHFISSYGMSELSPITATLYDDSVAHICRSVGKVADEVTVEILDFHTGESLPPGEENRGEIVVQGSSAMTAYYKLPPSSQAIDGEGRIRTGDFGFFDTEGYLHICGRMKELIHCGGKTIEPNAVGSVIAEYEPVSDVKVVGIDDPEDGEIAAACICLKKSIRNVPPYSEADLIAFLKTRLKDYQIPRKFILYEKLPTLANGKVDAVTLKKEAQEASIR